MEEIIKEIQQQLNSSQHNPSIKNDVACFLSNFCKEKQPKKILEIGTNLGKSSLIMLKNSPKSQITTLEKDEVIFEKARINFARAGVSKQIIQILGDAKQTLEKLPSNTFNLIFLDGPKAQYVKYLPQLKRLLASKGTLIADNVFFKGKVLLQQESEKKHRTIIKNLKEFLFHLQNDPSFKTQILNLGDGVSVSEKI